MRALNCVQRSDLLLAASRPAAVAAMLLASSCDYSCLQRVQGPVRCPFYVCIRTTQTPTSAQGQARRQDDCAGAFSLLCAFVCLECASASASSPTPPHRFACDPIHTNTPQLPKAQPPPQERARNRRPGHISVARPLPLAFLALAFPASKLPFRAAAFLGLFLLPPQAMSQPHLV